VATTTTAPDYPPDYGPSVGKFMTTMVAQQNTTTGSGPSGNANNDGWIQPQWQHMTMAGFGPSGNTRQRQLDSAPISTLPVSDTGAEEKDSELTSSTKILLVSLRDNNDDSVSLPQRQHGVHSFSSSSNEKRT
jgi:hypothetical protein